VGKSIWESIFRVLKGRSLKKDEFVYGWQEGEKLGVEEDAVDVEDGEVIKGWEGARVFVACRSLPSFQVFVTRYRLKSSGTRARKDSKTPEKSNANSTSF
jgi:hypothetical protein